MLQFGRRLGLCSKPLYILSARQFASQNHLHRDISIQAGLSRTIYHTHPTAGDLLQQCVVSEVANPRMEWRDGVNIPTLVVHWPRFLAQFQRALQGTARAEGLGMAGRYRRTAF
jgi:hypothetical protein